jgi:hypothetical protein
VGLDHPVQPAATASQQTVEAVVRAQLSRALGGKRGMLESAVPTIGFTLTWVLLHRLPTALIVAGVAAGALLLLRVVQRQPVQYVANAAVGVGVAAYFALRSGRAQDAFLPGILYNAGYAVAFTVSVLVRWPAVGFLIGAAYGDVTAWRSNKAVLRLCSKLTWLLVVPCLLRVLVQYPLWASGEVAWLGVAKIVLGWPLQVATFAAMALLLAHNRTPIQPAGARPGG